MTAGASGMSRRLPVKVSKKNHTFRAMVPLGLAADHFDKRGLGNRLENSFEHQKIDRFMAHCEGQVSFERRFGAISLVVDTPRTVTSSASENMPLRDAGRVANRCGHAE